MSVTRTNRELVMLEQALGAYLDSQKDRFTKLTYAANKILSAIRTPLTAYRTAFTDLNVEYAYVNDKGVIQKDARGDVDFTKDGLKARNAAHNALMNQPVECPTHLVKMPADLGHEYREIFAGILFEPPTEPTDE